MAENRRQALNRRVLSTGLMLIGFISIAFLILSAAPEHAHHLLLIIATTLIALGANALLTYRLQGDWVEVIGRITRIEERLEDVAISEYSRMTYCYPVIDYEYTMAGMAHFGDVVSLEKENVWLAASDPPGDPFPPEAKWWAKLSAGDHIPVFVNPRKPSESVLVRSLKRNRRSHHLALIVGGLMLAAAWCVLELIVV